MSRAVPWCILVIIRFASVLNRGIYSLLEGMYNFTEAVIQVYLSSIDSETSTEHQPGRSEQGAEGNASEKIGDPPHSSMVATGSGIPAAGLSIVPKEVAGELTKAKKITFSFEFSTDNVQVSSPKITNPVPVESESRSGSSLYSNINTQRTDNEGVQNVSKDSSTEVTCSTPANPPLQLNESNLIIDNSLSSASSDYPPPLKQEIPSDDQLDEKKAERSFSAEVLQSQPTDNEGELITVSPLTDNEDVQNVSKDSPEVTCSTSENPTLLQNVSNLIIDNSLPSTSSDYPLPLNHGISSVDQLEEKAEGSFSAEELKSPGKLLEPSCCDYTRFKMMKNYDLKYWNMSKFQKSDDTDRKVRKYVQECGVIKKHTSDPSCTAPHEDPSPAKSASKGKSKQRIKSNNQTPKFQSSPSKSKNMFEIGSVYFQKGSDPNESYYRPLECEGCGKLCKLDDEPNSSHASSSNVTSRRLSWNKESECDNLIIQSTGSIKDLRKVDEKIRKDVDCSALDPSAQRTSASTSIPESKSSTRQTIDEFAKTNFLTVAKDVDVDEKTHASEIEEEQNFVGNINEFKEAFKYAERLEGNESNILKEQENARNVKQDLCLKMQAKLNVKFENAETVQKELEDAENSDKTEAKPEIALQLDSTGKIFEPLTESDTQTDEEPKASFYDKSSENTDEPPALSLEGYSATSIKQEKKPDAKSSELPKQLLSPSSSRPDDPIDQYSEGPVSSSLERTKFSDESTEQSPEIQKATSSSKQYKKTVPSPAKGAQSVAPSPAKGAQSVAPSPAKLPEKPVSLSLKTKPQTALYSQVLKTQSPYKLAASGTHCQIPKQLVDFPALSSVPGAHSSPHSQVLKTQPVSASEVPSKNLSPSSEDIVEESVQSSIELEKQSVTSSHGIKTQTSLSSDELEKQTDSSGRTAQSSSKTGEEYKKSKKSPRKKLSKKKETLI